MGFVFLESENEKKYLLDKSMNHVGFGVDWNDEKIVLIMIISTQNLAI